jgi:cytoskeletal protein RodZ
MARGNFGERLKRERELREVTLDEINSATRISNRFLEAMENEDWQKLPGGVFNRGFVRSIARFLGLDEEGLLAEYDMAHGAQEQAAPKREEVRIPSPPRWVPVAAVLGLLLLLAGCIAGGIYAWRYFAARRAARQAGTASVRVSPVDTSAVLLKLNGLAMPRLSAPWTSGTITLGRKDLRREQSGATQRGSH